ncbi:MAG TPA: response regulator [Ferruginibacter sp.]|nr:response regulator [Ferruginibacter sp.]
MDAVILLIDDDMDDLLLLKEALLSIDNNCSVLTSLDGNKALAGLKETRDSNNRLPNLVVLDISMPIMDGRQLLAILKNEEKLKDLPIVVLTTSSNISDINYCKQFDIELITKPFELSQLYKIAEKLLSYCTL